MGILEWLRRLDERAAASPRFGWYMRLSTYWVDQGPPWPDLGGPPDLGSRPAPPQDAPRERQ